MKKVNVESKSQIKQLLYAACVFGIKDDRYRAFGGFQLWWYDKWHDTCDYCESRWADGTKKIHQCSLDRAAKILWHNRHCLYLRSKHVTEDRRLMAAGHFEHAGQ